MARASRAAFTTVHENPMAVELCKVNLWLEALEPGKPLSFLEHHIVPDERLADPNHQPLPRYWYRLAGL